MDILLHFSGTAPFCPVLILANPVPIFQAAVSAGSGKFLYEMSKSRWNFRRLAQKLFWK